MCKFAPFVTVVACDRMIGIIVDTHIIAANQVLTKCCHCMVADCSFCHYFWHIVKFGVKVQHMNGHQRLLQVLELGAASDGTRASESLEAVLSVDLVHPNIVQTYLTSTRGAPRVRPDRYMEPGKQKALYLECQWQSLCRQQVIQDSAERDWHRTLHRPMDVLCRAYQATSRIVSARHGRIFKRMTYAG